LRYFSAVWHTAGARINEVVLVTCTRGNLLSSASCRGTFMPILAVVLHPFLSVVLYHLPAVKIQPNHIHNQSFTTDFDQKKLRYFFGFPIAVKLNTTNHSQNPYAITRFSIPATVKNHYPLAVILCENLRYFSPLRRVGVSSPTISRKQCIPTLSAFTSPTSRAQRSLFP
jgi:hypothetical protein